MFSERLFELRTEHNLKQSELAEIIDSSVTSLSGYELGNRTPKIDVIIKICKAFDVSADWLLGLENKVTITGYKDIISCLDAIEKHVETAYTTIKSPGGAGIDEEYYSAIVALNDYHLARFIDADRKMKELLADNTISNADYEAWKRGKLSELGSIEKTGVGLDASKAVLNRLDNM